MRQPIYLIVAVPGSGKTWVTSQLGDKFEFVHHDLFIGQAGEAYVKSILKRAEKATKPLLTEAPFSISQTKDPLEAAGYKVIPIFIIESEPVLRDRYFKREKKSIPQGHITRMKTYEQRAHDWKAFKGTSQEVLEYLKKLP